MAVEESTITSAPTVAAVDDQPAYPHVVTAIATAPTLEVPAVSGGTYSFQVLPFGELGTVLPPALTREIADGLAAEIAGAFPAVEEIVTPEPGGHMWGALVADRLALPLRILRSKSADDAQKVAPRRAIYYVGQLHYSVPALGTRVVVVDDVVSSGGTLASIVANLASMGADVLGAQVVFAKGPMAAAREAAPGVPLQALVRA